MRFVVVLLVVLGSSSCVKREPLPPTSGYIPTNSAAPVSISLPLHGTGEVVNFEKLRGNVVLLDVWATWCEPCKDALPMYDALQKEYGARGLKVFAMNVDEDQAMVDPFLKEQKVTVPVLIDQRGEVAEKSLRVKLMPTSFLIDKKGIIRHVHEGFAEEFLQQYQTEIEALLAEKVD